MAFYPKLPALNSFWFHSLLAVERGNLPKKEGTRAFLKIYTSLLSVIVYSWRTSLPIQSSKHQALIVSVLALDRNHKKRKSSLCCGPVGSWQYLEMQSHAGGACVVQLAFIATLACLLTSMLIYVSQDVSVHLFLISWACIYFLAEY